MNTSVFSKPISRRLFSAGGALALVGAAIPLVGLSLGRRLILKQREVAEEAALLAAAHIAQRGAIPFAWAAGVFVPACVIENVSSLMRGTKIALTKFPDLPSDTIVELEGVVLRPDLGFAAVELALAARSESEDVSVALKAAGVLRYLGEESVEEGRREMKFGIDLTEVALRAGTSFFEVALSDFGARLLGSGAALALAEHTVLSLPVPAELETKLKLKGEEESPLRKGKVTTKWKAAPIELKKPVKIAGPIFTPQGMWLLGEVSNEADLPPVGRVEEARNIIERALAHAPHPNGAAAVWVHRKALEALAASVNQLRVSERHVEAEVAMTGDHLYHETWEFLGHGELKVDMDGTGRGRLNLGGVKTGWSAEQGVRLEAPLAASAKVPIKVHLDPGPSGGLGVPVGMEGKGEANFVAFARPEVRPLAGRQTLILRFDGAPTAAGFTIQTNGNCVTSVGTAHLAKVGARVTAQLDPSKLPPLVLCSGLPYYARTKMKGASLPWKGLAISVTPGALSLKEDGLLFEAAIHVAAAKRAPHVGDEIAKVDRACAALVEGSPVQNLKVEVLVAGLKIGPNNDIIRFFGNAISDITKGPGPNNEFVVAARTIGNDLIYGPGKNNDIVQWFRSPGKETERFVAATADKATALAEKGADAVAHVAKQVVDTAVAKPARWIKKTFGF